jgi:CMP-N-acetylneuraminic acid synthetase
MKTHAFIFARGGSKEIPGKNIQLLGGKPLLAWSIEIARNILAIRRTFVSTDNAEIAEVAQQFGAEVIDRPAELAQNDTPEWLAWQHAVKWVQKEYGNFDRFVSLPTTSPLRNKNDVLNCLNHLDNQTDIVVTITETSRSPWFNMVRVDEDEMLRLMADGNYTRRQDVPEGYDMTTVAYVTNPVFIMNNEKIWDGRVKGILIPRERALDIDTELDLKIAEFLMQCQSTKMR